MLKIIVNIQLGGGRIGSVIKELIRDTTDDNRGASMLEYSVLIGIILATSLLLIVFAGQWTNAQWNALQTALSGNGAAIG